METTKSPLHIAIIGAGIGGLALAIGLLHENVPYTLYEAAGEYAMIGAGVGLGPNAMRAMDMIDKRFGELYKGISTGNMTPNREHVMMDILLMEEGLGKQRGWDGKPIEAERYTRTSAHRKALLDIMTSMIPLSTVKFNKRVKTMKHVGDHVVITFSDGEVVEASAVIGCDGAKGASRAAVLGETHPELVEATYSKKYVYRSIVPMKDAEEILGFHARDAKLFMGHQSNFMTFPIANGNQYNVVAFKLTEEPWTHDQWTKEVSREEMLGDFAEGCDKRLVKLLDWAKPVRWSIWHHLVTPVYYNGLICLLGDSAHGTTPHQAAGAGQCLEDALILSRILGLVKDPADTETAFKVYDSIRRPRAQKVVVTSQETGLIYAMSHPDLGTDLEKISENLNKRYLWIWEHDLEADVKTAEADFKQLTKA